jgi:hypothetical protein
VRELEEHTGFSPRTISCSEGIALAGNYYLRGDESSCSRVMHVAWIVDAIELWCERGQGIERAHLTSSLELEAEERENLRIRIEARENSKSR